MESDTSFEVFLQNTPDSLLFHKMVISGLIALMCFGVIILCLAYVITQPNFRVAVTVASMTFILFFWKGFQAISIMQELLLRGR